MTSSAFLLKDTEKLRFSWASQRKPAYMGAVCSLAANGLCGWYLGPMFSITDEEKRKRRHSKMGRAQEMSEIRVQGSSEKASTHHQTWGERFLLTPQLPLI